MPDAVFVFSPEVAGDAGTVDVALEFLYLGTVQLQHSFVFSDRWLKIVCLSDFLQADTLAHACKVMFHIHMDKLEEQANDESMQVCCYCNIYFIYTFITVFVFVLGISFPTVAYCVRQHSSGFKLQLHIVQDRVRTRHENAAETCNKQQTQH